MNQGIGNRPFDATACETCGGKLGRHPIFSDLGAFCSNSCHLVAESECKVGEALEAARRGERITRKPRPRSSKP